MNEQQFQLLKKMVQTIQEYTEEKIKFHTMVCRLEDTLDLAQSHDQGLVRQLDEYFHPIEEADSDSWHDLEDPDYQAINQGLQKMKEFILAQEQNYLSESSHPAVHHKTSHSKGL